VVKIQHVPREEVVVALGQIESQEIVDVREI
jgi:hypothetical protein